MVPPKAKVRQFQPDLYNGRWELSTFSVDGLDDASKWGLMDLHSDKPVVAKSELATSDVTVAGLLLAPDWDPERHVNLLGWPDTEDGRKSMAQVLHAKQRFVLRPAA